jgi:TetR/AcrR family transcriptional regulator
MAGPATGLGPEVPCNVDRTSKSFARRSAKRPHGSSQRRATIQQIADEVGISKQLLLYHYASKEALRSAVMHGLLEAWNDLMPRLLDAVATPGERSPEVLDDLLDYLDQTSELGRLAMMELMVGKAALGGEGLSEAVRPWLRVAADFIRRRQADGVFRADADPEAAVVQIGTLLLSTISLLHLHAVEWPEGVDTRAWRRRRLLEAIRMVRVSLAVDEAD